MSKKIQKYKQIFKNELKKNLRAFELHKKLAFFSMMVVPITSFGAGMTIYIDNTSEILGEPIFATDTVVNLDENIVVNFSDPIKDTEKYEKAISVYPYTDMQFFWGNNGGRLTIVPQSIWDPSTKYSLIFPYNIYDNNDQLSTIFSFETIAYPEIVETNVDDQKYISKGKEIIIRFNQAVDSFDIHAVARPAIVTKQVYDSKKRELRITFEEESHSEMGFHTLTIFAKHIRQNDSHFFPLKAVSFNAILPQSDLWPKKHQERAEIARKSTTPQIIEGKYIDVNLEDQITTLFENGKFVVNFISSTGAVDTPTPTGQFQIYNKHPYALSNMFQVYLPFWMAFTPDGKYGFHDLVVWPEGHEKMPSGGKESDVNIGRAVSPGCVRHDAENSQFLYEWAEIGTPVIIY
ncbi:MAG: hypothetical protein CR972_04870 [Candidatus Moraniibacteriota bacterium]|nr:MAG: hypothetical protein CR972_04870 [Candidatus Moranbacteria bacterium]